jgi:hypothetical protein
MNEMREDFDADMRYPNTIILAGFQGEDKFALRFQKVEIRMEIQAELEKRGIDYVMNSSFNPDKLTITIKGEL